MNNTGMPPIPRAGEYGPHVCAIVRLYLAVQNDLSPEQVQQLYLHVNTCTDCAEELRLLNRTTHVITSLPQSSPSARVDQAIMAAIAARNDEEAPIGNKEAKEKNVVTSLAGVRPPFARSLIPVRPLSQRRNIRKPRPAWLGGSIVAAAMILLAFLTTMHFIGLSGTGTQAFALPSDLSWSNYVLYHSQTDIGANGVRYHVESYHDLGTNRMHVETTMMPSLDVVVVGDETHGMLGKDMIHHVAQWEANAWAVDDSTFNLDELRHDMQDKSAIYLDKDNFRGRDVYRIRLKNGQVLLLDMHYMPVNVLQGAVGPGTGKPMYDTLEMLVSSQVSTSMWNMSVPSGFNMGTLPEKP